MREINDSFTELTWFLGIVPRFGIILLNIKLVDIYSLIKSSSRSSLNGRNFLTNWKLSLWTNPPEFCVKRAEGRQPIPSKSNALKLLFVFASKELSATDFQKWILIPFKSKRRLCFDRYTTAPKFMPYANWKVSKGFSGHLVEMLRILRCLDCKRRVST